MRIMKFAWIAASTILSLFIASNAEAITISQPPVDSRIESPVIITGYGYDGTRLPYIQLFNSSDEVVDITDWVVQVGLSDGSVIPLVTLHGLMKPGGYIVAADTSAMATPDVSYNLTLPAGVTPNSFQVMAPSLYLPHSLISKADASHPYWQRNVSSSTGGYLSTFSSFTPGEQFVLYGDGSYEYPDTVSLQVTEILANPRMCSPLEVAADCADYVKFYNPSSEPIDLSLFRLRVGYLGQNTSPSNAFKLQGIVEPGHFIVVAMSDDNRPIALTNSGAFIWLEDVYGVKQYEPTVLEYPDASADTKKGQAWAYDTTDGMWKWTSQPTPLDSPSVFPIPVSARKASATNSPTPCKEGQYRSEETNRCRTAAGGTVLAPCDDDEERNPATNRCRKLATTANQTLTPCKEGQERNPATNRCRTAIKSFPNDTAFAVETMQDAGKAFIGWWALGGVGVVALGYGVWEWREEIKRAIRKGVELIQIKR